MLCLNHNEENTRINVFIIKGKEKDIGRVGSWAADFDKLLRDTAGLQTFAEFLKKEFRNVE